MRPASGDPAVPTYSLPENDELFAVVIGLEKYRDIPSVPNAEGDARAVLKHLIALGYPEHNIQVLTNDRATRADMVKYFEPEWEANPSWREEFAPS